ncbi:Hypothetical protein, putative, partial [Bodo saltans]
MIFPCANISNSSLSPTLVPSNTTLLALDCNTALASWDPSSILQIRLSPEIISPTASVLQNIHIEIRGSSILPHISILDSGVVVAETQNITVILTDMVPTGSVASRPPLSHSLFDLVASFGHISRVRVNITNLSLASFNASNVWSLTTMNALSVTAFTSNITRVLLPGGDIPFRAAGGSITAISLVYINAEEYGARISATFSFISPTGQTELPRLDDGNEAGHLGWSLSMTSEGSIDDLSFSMLSSTLPQCLGGALIQPGFTDTYNVTRDTSRVTNLSVVWDFTTLLGDIPNCIVIWALFLERVNARFGHIRGSSGPTTTVNNLGSLLLFAPQPFSIYGIGHAHNINVEVYDVVFPQTVYGPFVSIAHNSFVENVTVSVHDVRSLRPSEVNNNQPPGNTATLTTSRELFLLCGSDVTLTRIVLLLKNVTLVNIVSTANGGVFTELPTDLMTNITVILQDVFFSGSVIGSVITIARSWPLFDGLTLVLTGITVDVNCTIYNYDCSLFKAPTYNSDSSQDRLANVEVDITQSNVVFRSLCPAGQNSSSSTGLLAFDGRWTDGVMRVRQSTFVVVTAAENPILLTNNIRSLFILHMRGAFGRHSTLITGPFSNVTFRVEQVTLSVTSALGGLLRLSGALAGYDIHIHVSRVNMTGVFSSVIFGDDPLVNVNAPNMVVVAASVPFQDCTISVVDTSMNVTGISGIPKEFVDMSTVQTVVTAVVLLGHLRNSTVHMVRTSLGVRIGNGSLSRISNFDPIGTMIVGQISANLVMIAPANGMSFNTIIHVNASSISNSADVASDARAYAGVIAIATAAVQIVNCTSCEIMLQTVQVRIDRAIIVLPASQQVTNKVETLAYAAGLYSETIAAFASSTIVNPFLKSLGQTLLNIDAPSILSNVTIVIENVSVVNNVDQKYQKQPVLAIFAAPSSINGRSSVILSTNSLQLGVGQSSNSSTTTARAAVLCMLSCVLEEVLLKVHNNSGTFPAIIVTSRGASTFAASSSIAITDSFVACNSAAANPCALLLSVPNVMLPVSLVPFGNGVTNNILFASNLTIAGSMFLHRNRLVGFQAITTTIVQLSLTSSAFLQQAVQVDASTATLLLGCN